MQRLGFVGFWCWSRSFGGSGVFGGFCYSGGILLLQWCLGVMFAVVAVVLLLSLVVVDDDGWFVAVHDYFSLRQNSVDAFFTEFSPATTQSDGKCRLFCLYQKLPAVSTKLDALVDCSFLRSVWVRLVDSVFF
ncbi:hypothetical protein A2U01_0013546 [Trifolium medium]|uniref:Transmembrane protein n=1 Tax=Trifolium medium TaxID=97028 RepID=A0A392MYI7_9FABA|nr:hypothetical protein [Trifolium medium]